LVDNFFFLPDLATLTWIFFALLEARQMPPPAAGSDVAASE
jgi:hypothetical protein